MSLLCGFLSVVRCQVRILRNTFADLIPNAKLILGFSISCVSFAQKIIKRRICETGLSNADTITNWECKYWQSEG